MPEFDKDGLSISRSGTSAPLVSRRIIARCALFAALACLLVGIALTFEDLTRENHVRDRKLQVSVEMLQVSKRIEAQIFAHMIHLSELATTIGQNPTINRTEFNIQAVDHLLAHSDIVYLAAAPENRFAMVFPPTGNEGLIGQQLRLDQNARSEADTVPAAQDGMVLTKAFQVPGRDPGLLLARHVVDATAGRANADWGSVVLVLDSQRFLNGLNIADLDARFELVIRDLAAPAAGDQQIVMGNPDVLTQDPLLLDFDLPMGRLQLAAIPLGGWPMQGPNFLPRILLEMSLIVALLAGLWYVMRLADTRRAAERMLSVGIEALDSGFVMFDADRRLVAFNRRYKEIAGVSGQVRLGQRYEDIVKGSLAAGMIPDAIGREEEWFRDWARRFEESQMNMDSDREQILPDGRIMRAYDRSMPDGSFIGLRIDISDLKKAQLEAEAANKAKTDFLGVLSHELRTPLTVILGQAKLAQNLQFFQEYRALEREIEQLPGDPQDLKATLDALLDKLTRMMEGMERSGNHLFTLISEILDFAKIESGTLVMEMTATSTEDIALAVADQMRPLIEGKGLAFDIATLSLPLTGDEKRLRQVLINLIGNALKFTDEGTISLEVTEDETHAMFTVGDSGIGIPEDELTRIFEAFQQVDSTSTRKYGGTGLGLAISRDIALAHGGQLTVTSKPGQGSRFTLRLPKAVPGAGEDAQSAPLALAG
jgi:two-component system, cell cycle sensor histidine kinase PleC